MIKKRERYWLLFGRFLCVVGVIVLAPLAVQAQDSSRRGVSNDEKKAGAISESADEIANTLHDASSSRETVFKYHPLRDSLEKWGDFWQVVDEKTGLSMAFAYTTLFQSTTKGSYQGASSGGSGDLDLISRWDFFRPEVHKGFLNTGTIGVLGEYRHRTLGSTTPSELGDTIGSLWGTTSGFNEQDLTMTQWWWQQLLFDDRVGFRVGKIDMSGIFDVYRFGSANHFFTNQAFSDNPAIPFPQNGFGGVIRVDPGHDFFAIVGMADANGRKTETSRISRSEVDEWFSAVTLGWNPKVGNLGKGLYQLTLWNSDGQNNSIKPDATGYSVIVQQDFGNGWTPFARYSASDNPVVDTKKIVTGGVVHEGVGKRENDRLGAALAWGQPHNPLFRDQWTAELFYRWAASPELRITPMAQIVMNPSRNPDDQVIGLFGVRGRLTF